MVQNTNKQNKRTFAEIAREIKQTWKNVYFGAKPYLQAMATINSSDKNAPYMLETAEDIKKGLQKALNKGGYSAECAMNLINADDGNLDQPQAEELVQYIMFGESIYG